MRPDKQLLSPNRCVCHGVVKLVRLWVHTVSYHQYMRTYRTCHVHHSKNHWHFSGWTTFSVKFWLQVTSFLNFFHSTEYSTSVKSLAVQLLPHPKHRPTCRKMLNGYHGWMLTFKTVWPLAQVSRILLPDNFIYMSQWFWRQGISGTENEPGPLGYFWQGNMVILYSRLWVFGICDHFLQHSANKLMYQSGKLRWETTCPI